MNLAVTYVSAIKYLCTNDNKKLKILIFYTY